MAPPQPRQPREDKGKGGGRGRREELVTGAIQVRQSKDDAGHLLPHCGSAWHGTASAHHGHNPSSRHKPTTLTPTVSLAITPVPSLDHRSRSHAKATSVVSPLGSQRLCLLVVTEHITCPHTYTSHRTVKPSPEGSGMLVTRLDAVCAHHGWSPPWRSLVLATTGRKW